MQGRLFSYPDTQRHRLGPNFAQIPVNCPYAKKVSNYQRDGAMRIDGNGGSSMNYHPNSYGGTTANASYSEHAIALHGAPVRAEYPTRSDDFEQAGMLFRLLKPEERKNLISNIAGHMKSVDKEIQIRQLKHFYKADKDYGTLLAQALGLKITWSN